MSKLLMFRRYLRELQQPQNIKYKKKFKGRIPVNVNMSTKGRTLCHGQFGLQVLEGTRLTIQQLESARKTTKRTLDSKNLQMFLRVVPDIPVTKKAIGVRMGKGKADVDHYMARVPEGKIVFEIGIHPMIAHASPSSTFQIDQNLLDLKKKDQLMRKHARAVSLPKIGYQLPLPTAAQVEQWLPRELALEALKQAAFKLPCKCKVIINQ
eukprot:NODE_241_length_13209_cov_0.424256.p6 type:complete len:209 gc:universal NODE_241_length_13209_cov_0.424256:7174-6548(-)